MILENQRIVFKKLLGPAPITQILEWMERQDPPVTNQFGNVFSISYVTRIFNGKHQNFKVEKAIWDCVKEEMVKRKEIKKEQEKLINELEVFTNEEPA